MAFDDARRVAAWLRLDDVVYLDDLRLAGVDAEFVLDGHEALAECGHLLFEAQTWLTLRLPSVPKQIS